MIVEVVLIGLATWRISSLLVNESGPSDIFGKIRRRLGVPEQGEVKGFFPSLLSCIWCLSTWIAPLFWVIWTYWAPEPVMIIAAMTVTVLFAEVIEWLEQRR